MPMHMTGDCGALESFPLRLLIVATVAALSIVPAADALEVLQNRDFLSRVGLVMDKVVHAAQMVSMQGPGASRTVDVDISSDGGLKAVRVVIGDDPMGPRAGALVLELSSGGRIVRLAQYPPARMSSPFGHALEVGSDRFCLRMTACLMDGVCVVSVEVL